MITGLLAVVALVAVIICGVLAMRLSGSNNNSETEAELARTRQRLDEAMMRITDLTAKIEERSHMMEQRAEEQRRVAAMEFRTVARQAMQESSTMLRSENTRELGELISPLREQLGSFHRAVNESYVNENASRKSLADQIERLMKLNMTIGEEARNLTSALKGNTKLQGDWGEMILKTLLESAGMQEGVNFFTQVTADASGRTLRDEESGRGLRPDVVISLPDNHKIIVDSKVSLTAYADYNEAKDEAALETCGRRHLLSVRKHIAELADKAYQKVVAGAAEHVLMFIPNEGAFMLAYALDPDIWRYAYERKVVITSPTHLFSVMQIVSQLWRQENQSRNAAEIARQGGALYDKFVGFMATFQTIETNLARTQKACDEARKSLSGSNQSLAAKAERLRSLGAKTTKSLSEETLSQISIDPSGLYA